MRDLAPNHKLGLSVANPILLAGGTIGYGEAVPKGLDTALLGAVVVGPILGSSRGGAALPRLAHLNSGIILDTGMQNRGASQVLQRFARLWPRLGCPVIVQVAENYAAGLAKIVKKLAEVEGISGVELLPPPQVDGALLTELVRVIDRHADLPIWVKLPLHSAVALAPAAVDAGAAGIVVGQPLQGAALRTLSDGVTHPVRGAVLGPLAFAPMLQVLLDVAALKLPAALIACGGIHTIDHVRQALAAGAQAVQIDSAVWVEPSLPASLVAALSA